MTEKPRQRRFTRRSRTGCRTCRVRHIKCDETPIVCNNCTSAGWKCDGYDASQSEHPAYQKDRNVCVRFQLPYSHGMVKAQPGRNLNERRAFAFFRSSTVPKMGGFFNSCLWDKLVLPMCHAEPAVSHAVVALSTLHEDLEIHDTPLSREDLGNNRHRLAMEQYGWALSALSKRRCDHDPNLRHVVLTCCLLFVVFELLRGRYDPALLHLENGLSIIQDRGWTDGDDQHGEGSLTVALSRLDSQAIFFGARKHYCYQNATRYTVSEAEPHTFRTVAEARKEFDRVLNRVLRFVRYVRLLPSEDPSLSKFAGHLDEYQHRLKAELDSYEQCLGNSKEFLLQTGGHREERAFDLIRLHHLCLSTLLDTCLDNDEAVDSKVHLDRCEDLIVLSEMITESVRAESDSEWKSLPSLSLDTGIIPSLLYVCTKCPYTPMRQRALRLLDAWPHREGLWDSNLVAILARKLMAIEVEVELQRLFREGVMAAPIDITYISRHSRVKNAFMRVEEDQTHAVITYMTQDAVTKMTDHFRLVDVDGRVSAHRVRQQ